MELPLELLRCPSCRGRLVIAGDDLRCGECGEGYPSRDGIWDLVPRTSQGVKLSEREHYDRHADHYLRMHQSWCRSPYYRHYHASFLDLLHRLPPGSLILETGCGLGYDGLELLRSGYRLVETDIAPGQLAMARKLHHQWGFAASSTHLLADAERLPFASDTFDGGLMVASLHHLPDPLAALREMRRVIRPGGTLVLGTEPNSWQNRTVYPLGKKALETLRRLTGRGGAERDMVSEGDKLAEGFSARLLRDLLREAGFGSMELLPAGYLAAAVFSLSTEISSRWGRDLKLFPLERLFIPLDELLGRLPLFRRFPWNWNAAAS